jgi:hypothetical protein
MQLPKDVTSEDVHGGTRQDTGKYPYCGPFTKLDKKLSQGYWGVNIVDRGCLNHSLTMTSQESLLSSIIITMSVATSGGSNR